MGVACLSDSLSLRLKHIKYDQLDHQVAVVEIDGGPEDEKKTGCFKFYM